ncbi:hypothetical protein DKG34_05895 [Streptomyces sp. NWU49]|uniref:hypothetical protein n=1 Tax=Streptomyces sp. NWU49 TaxID=2201153 RepID=UPI000D67C7C9|nr:hypothetical protein [Streptomyces sp. NWU49]PWJ08045.1 hypothetical protein DKG34_05895 [Streptomyces sp. NWU49]
MILSVTPPHRLTLRPRPTPKATGSPPHAEGRSLERNENRCQKVVARGFDEYCWLTAAERPGEHPVLARAAEGTWHWYDASPSEFLHRVLADADFQPCGVARYALDPTFEPGAGVNE